MSGAGVGSAASVGATIAGARHVLVDASAGTGKTYTLSSRMIRVLMARGAGSDPAGVLATTFTKKAAGEITRRVFERLLEAQRSPAALGRLRDETGIRALTPEDCALSAAGLARRMDRLRIMTIDSLMAKMARASGLELEVAPGWGIGSDTDLGLIRGEAIEAALAEGDGDQTLALARLMSRNPLAREVHGALARAVKDTHAAFRAAGGSPAPWGVVGPKGQPLDADQLRRAIGRLREAELPRTKAKGEPDGRFAKAVEALETKVLRAEWVDLVTTGLGAAVLGSGTYSTVAIPERLSAAVWAIVEHASWHVLSQLQGRNRATAALLGRYDRLVWEARRGRGLLSFDDVPRLLHEADVGERLGELWYRLDGAIDELLIDEAQDTSLLQFRLIEPILSEMLSGGERGVLIVGDVKQSLYGWRQAEAELLGAIGARWEVLRRVPLTESHRSSQVVLDAVNTVFEGLGGHAALSERDGAREAGVRMAGLFRSHTASARAGGAEGVGLVRMMTHPWQHGEAERPKADRVGGAVGAVEGLLAEAGAAGVRVEVGVLVRTNSPIRPLVAAMRARGIDAREEGGAPLAEDPAVAAALSLLHWADHPTDELALFHVAMSPIGLAMGWEGVPTRRVAGARASKLRRRLASRGYAEVLERLAERTAGGFGAASNERMDQLIELAREFDTRGSLRPSEFVSMVCERKVEAGTGGGQVRVMTLHRAKGLEFDAVVLPELERSWSANGKGAMLRRPGVLGTPDAASLCVGAGVERIDPVLMEMVRQRDGREVFEELCGLYVGMTRARRALVMLVDPFKKADKKGVLPFKASGVLRGSLAGDVAESGEGALLFERRRGPWWEGLAGARAEAGTQGQHVRSAPKEGEEQSAGGASVAERGGSVGLRLARGRAGSLRRAALVSPSSMEGGGKIDLAGRLVGEEGGRGIGSIAHAMLAEVGWLDDGVPGREVLWAAGRASGGGDREVDVAAGLVERALAGPAGACLKRSWHHSELVTKDQHTPHPGPLPIAQSSDGQRGGERLDLRREWRFLHEEERGGEQRLVSGVIDRLVVRWEGGAAVGADVIDYKTDRLEGAAGLAGKVAYYGPQVRAYCDAVSRMFGIERRMVRGVLVFVGGGEVVEV